MDNFTFKNPTEIVFGRGMIKEIRSRVPVNVPVMIVCGGGSIKRNGVYAQVKKALKKHRVIEFWGIEPNPLYETCLKAVELVKKNKVKFLLAVGGGSVLDAAKMIAATAVYKGKDPWDILRTNGAGLKDALPLGTVLTLPATGSESNGNSVISRKATQEKLFFGAACVFPVFSVLDPVTTFSLPKKQVRNGIVDAFAHVMEQYMTYPVSAPLQDRFAEGILQTLVEVGPRTLRNMKDYDSRASFMWSATLALNNLISCGVPQDWTTHMIGHEVTAFYGLDHAETLAIIMPGVWMNQLERKQAKLRQYGERIFGVKTAKAAIARTEKFFNSISMPTRFKDYDIDAAEVAKRVSARFAERGSKFGEHNDITPRHIADILASRK
ncbi:MAG: aldehyde reductase [Lentisphaerae bacterium RIFOXYA12_FULL_48_11]|nr:MAG: aldehyde reductase [Lentisphaerae bacterium RIFOXYA12_FULL_48_11]